MFPGTRAQTTTAQWFDAAECRAESDIFTQQNIKLEVKHCVCLQQRRIKHAGRALQESTYNEQPYKCPETCSHHLTHQHTQNQPAVVFKR